ncbi:MAG: DUF6128 domain-containing protein [[Clostridium] scindens]
MQAEEAQAKREEVQAEQEEELRAEQIEEVQAEETQEEEASMEEPQEQIVGIEPVQEELQAEEAMPQEEMPASRFQCKKIQRNELAGLPRCEWRLSNNNFLLHGYYNYHHLAMIDDGERLRLGVPGIYHPQEAKAAAAFGFPEFIRRDDLDIELAEDEDNGQEQFGYWCRYVKRPATPGSR